MAKRKGMSAEEKRRVILSIYHTTKDVFNLKEIETLASKQGVVQQSVKEVNQGLCDDGLVDTDKIGSGNFFWSFPGKALTQKRKAASDLEREVTRLKTDVASLEEKSAKLQEGRKETAERTRMQREYAAALELKAAQERELQKFADNDPEKVDKLRKALGALNEGATRWTDNVFGLKKFMVKKYGMPSKDVDRFIGINDSFAYPDE